MPSFVRAFSVLIAILYASACAASTENQILQVPASVWRNTDIGVLAILLLYYIFIWYLYGRAPKRESIHSSLIPPENLTPGQIGYIDRGKLDNRAFCAEILALAVNERIQLENFTAEEKLTEKNASKTKTRYSSLERMMGRKYRLRMTSDSWIPVNTTEEILLHNLFSQSQEKLLTLDESGKEPLHSAFRALERHFMETSKRYLFRHTKLWGIGLMFFEAYTAFAMFFVLSQGVGGVEPDSEHALAFMAPLFFLAPVFGGEKLWKKTTPLFILRTVIPLFFCICALILLRRQGTDLVSIAALTSSVALIGIFWKLAPSHSEEGVHLLDKISGFKLGLGSRAELKEQDTVDKFESLLPYAYALNRERPLIARYDPLISRLRHYAHWHTADTHNFSGGAEYYSLSYELGEAVQNVLRNTE